MLRLATEKLLNLKLIWDNPICFKFMQVHENEEDQAASLTKETKRVLSLIHTRYKNNNKIQEDAEISNLPYHFQGIKYVQ